MRAVVSGADDELEGAARSVKEVFERFGTAQLCRRVPEVEQLLTKPEDVVLLILPIHQPSISFGLGTDVAAYRFVFGSHSVEKEL
jgi:hypothetical protein